MADTRLTDGPLEKRFIQLALIIGVVAWVAVLLAELGHFSVGWLVAGVAVAGLALRGAVGPLAPLAPPVDTVGPHHRGQPMAVGALLLLATALYVPPYETALWASDSTAYLNVGRQISERGSLVFADPFVAEVPPALRRELFLNRMLFDATGEFARFPGGFVIPDITTPRVTAGFSPLLPALVALFHLVFGPGGAIWVAPVFAILGVGAIYLVGVRLHGPVTGLLAAALLAVSAPQAWFAKFGLPAVVSQFFVLAGLLTLLVSLDRDRPRLAAASGWLLGLAMLGKFDLLAVLPVSVVSVLAVALLRGGGTRAVAVHFLVGFAIPLLHTVLHLLVFPSHYRLLVQRLIGESLRPDRLGSLWLWVALVGVVVAVGVAVTRRRALGPFLATMVVFYAAWYVTTSENRLSVTVPWLGWYLSWPVVALAVAGVVASLATGWRGRAPVPLLVTVPLVVASGHYLFDPYETPELVWSMRRLVPMVVPGLFLAAACVVADTLARLSNRRVRWGATALAAATLVVLAGRPGIALVGERLWAGAFEQTRQIADAFPSGAVVLVAPELAGTHLQTSLAYLEDVDTLLIQPRYDYGDPFLLETAVRHWLGRGRPVFALFGPGGSKLFGPRLALSAPASLHLELPVLETAVTRRPEAVVTLATSLQVFELSAGPGVPRTSVDIGTETEDGLFALQRFHGPERDPASELGSYRWTSLVASLTVPATPQVSLVLAGGRPDGVPPATVSIWIDQERIVQDLVVPNAVTTIRLSHPAPERRPVAEVTIRSTVFNPASLGLSADTRDLGVRVYRAGFSDSE